MTGARRIPGTSPLVDSTLTTAPSAPPRGLELLTLRPDLMLPPGLALEESGAPGDFSIEGIKISEGEGAGTGPAAEASRVVSIIADASRDDIKRAIEEKSRGPQPVILSLQKMPAISPTDIDAVLETSQFERQIIGEAIIGGYNKVKGALLQTQAKAAAEETLSALKSTDEKISAISYMLDTMETAASGLNVSKMSEQIMQKAADALGEITTQTESANPRLPKDLDDYIALTFRNQNASISGNVDRYLTNTSRMALLAQDMLLACLTAHPTLLSKFSRGDLSSASNIFSIPGRYGYEADGSAAGSTSVASIPTVNELFARNLKTIKYQFETPAEATSGYVGDLVDINSERPIVKSPYRQNPGFLSTTVSTSATQDEMWDDIIHSICALSNEFVMSAGVGRLLGSRLGARYLITSDMATNPRVDPFSKIFGFSPTASAGDISRFFTTGPTHAGSFLDYLALGEEDVENRDVIVMPFETDTVQYNSTYYVSGDQYFIDLALHPERAELRGALANFSSKYATLMKDMSAYLTELMALDSPTPLAPELLMARVLQDFQGILTSFSEATIDNEKSALVASLFAVSGINDRQYTVDIRTIEAQMKVTTSDLIKMSVIKALKDFDSLSDNSSFVLSQAAIANIDVYETVIGKAPSENLKVAIDYLGGLNGLLTKNRADIESAIGSTDRSAVSRTFFYYHDGSAAHTFLHDSSFSSRTNLINLVARTVREIQREALNLAQRSGSESDYRNSQGGTYMSNCDEDRLIDVVCTIYTNLAYLLLPISLVKESDPISTTSEPPTWKLAMVFNQDMARRGKNIITDVIESLVNGAPITASEVFNRTLLDPETQISLSPTGGDNTEVTTVASVTDACSRMSKHRYYIKASLKVLESTATAVSAADATASQLFDILNGTIERKNLKGPSLKLYDMFVTDIDTNSDLLKNMSESQVNLCVSARRMYGMPDTPSMRSDISTTTAERLALRDYIKSVYEVQSIDDMHVASVAIPRGLIDSLYYGSFQTRSSTALAAYGTERNRDSKYIKIDIDRFDNAYINSRSSVQEGVFSRFPETEFDPEIFVLSDSISYDPLSKSPGAFTVFDAIFFSTKFYRIRRGKIIETFSGIDASPSIERFCKNALRSYLLDLYMCETSGIRYCDGASPYGAPKLSRTGYQFVLGASENSDGSLALINKVGFVDIFDAVTRQVKTGGPLRSLITPVAEGRAPEFLEQDIRFAALLACAVPLSDTSDIVRLRPFERVYHFIYDESIVRNNISGDTAGTSDGVITNMKSSRTQFDIFSLSARAIRGAT